MRWPSRQVLPYMVKKTFDQIELNLLKAFFAVWDILFSYSETLSENGSHELTGALHILGPTLEAMNWRHCIPRVGVHYIESTLCPTVADWRLSDRGRLEPVKPWSIGACPTLADWSAWSCHLSPRWHSLPMLHVIWIVPLFSMLFIHQVDITQSLFQIPRCSLRLSMFPAPRK